MRRFLLHWYDIAVYVAAAFALALGLGTWNMQQTGLLLGMVFIQLHFFEEFGYPGGFIWCGAKVELRRVPQDVSSWPLTQLSCLWGNEWFALAVYALPLLFPQITWAVLAAFVFAYAELVLHGIAFNASLRTLYNPGLITAIALSVVSTWYLVAAVPLGVFTWADLGIAVAWCAFNYWMAFKSPVTKLLNRNKAYVFSREDVWKAKRLMDKFPEASQGLANFRDDSPKR